MLPFIIYMPKIRPPGGPPVFFFITVSNFSLRIAMTGFQDLNLEERIILAKEKRERL